MDTMNNEMGLELKKLAARVLNALHDEDGSMDVAAAFCALSLVLSFLVDKTAKPDMKSALVEKIVSTLRANVD